MKKIILATILMIILSVGIAFAVQEASCSPNSTFWGTRCCVYSLEDDPYVPTLIQKCCDYRIWINFGCQETAFYP